MNFYGGTKIPQNKSVRERPKDAKRNTLKNYERRKARERYNQRIHYYVLVSTIMPGEGNIIVKKTELLELAIYRQLYCHERTG
jgi:hypothetical protein